MVGCRANEIENLLTAEPRVVSEKEKNRYLKFKQLPKEGHFKIGQKVLISEEEVRIKWHAVGIRKSAQARFKS